MGLRRPGRPVVVPRDTAFDSMTWLLVLLLAAGPEGDPRIPLVEARLAGDPQRALAEAARLENAQPELAGPLGVSYYQGRVLHEGGRFADAYQQFAQAMREAESLRPYTRYWLGRETAAEHPEMTASIIWHVVEPDTPSPLLESSTRLLAEAVTTGGDCALLRRVPVADLPGTESRRLQVVQAWCADRMGQTFQAVVLTREILAESRTDEPARQAADLLSDLFRRIRTTRSPAEQGEIHRLLGLTYHHHREYDRSIPYLEQALAALSEGRRVSSDEEWETRYALARGYFWREQFQIAARRFGELAIRARNLEERSQALYQQARCLELTNDWQAADAAFRRTYSTLPSGRYAGPALLSAARIEWRTNNERDALELYARLQRHPGSGEYAARAALFFASSNLARGTVGSAGDWLSQALAADPDVALEVAYWRGRLAELEDAPERAVRSYVEVVLRDAYHPLAQSARERLELPELRVGVTRELSRRSGSARNEDLYVTWLLAGEGTVAGRAASRLLTERYAATRSFGALYDLEPVPVARWPLWQQTLDTPIEQLLALGMVEEIAPQFAEFFPASDPDLAYTGALALARALEVRRSILLAGNLSRRLDGRVEPPFEPVEIRQLMHPYPWRPLIESKAEDAGTDPLLLVSIMREESRFDPEALSPVSARGLTQFVWLTARRVAAETGLGRISPDDIYRPEVAIHLGAHYIAELVDDFRGHQHAAVAAYNAGPAQARLWQAYCYTGDLAEYYSKTGFSETRNYLRKVLSSRAQYTELYGD